MQHETSFCRTKRTKAQTHSRLLFIKFHNCNINLISSSSTSFKSHARIKDFISAISLTLSGPAVWLCYIVSCTESTHLWPMGHSMTHTGVRSHANLFDERDPDKRAWACWFYSICPSHTVTVHRGYFSLRFSEQINCWIKLFGLGLTSGKPMCYK